MNLKENIFEIIQLSKSKIAKDSAIVLTGNIIGAGLGFIATILITRTLGPAQFGLFSVAIAVMGITSQISDFGINSGLVRFASLYLKNDNQKANLMFKVSLKFKLISSILVFLIGFFASESLAIHVFGKTELILPLKLSFIGVFGLSFVGYISTTLQARQSFVKFALVNLIDPLGKLTLIGLLFLTYKLNLLSALTTVVILPFIAFLIGSLIIPKDFLMAKGDENAALNELFHFSKWIFVSVFCVTIFTQLDVLMLSYFKIMEEVGYYSAGYRLGFSFSIILGSFITILLPIISKLTEKQQIINYRKKTLKITLFIAIIFFPIFFLAKPLILAIYGVPYLDSVIIFQILFLKFLLVLIFNPINIVIYSINKPMIASYGNLLQLSFNFIGNYLVIPMYGAYGAAIVSLITDVIGVSFMLYYLHIHFKNWKM